MKLIIEGLEDYDVEVRAMSPEETELPEGDKFLHIAFEEGLNCEEEENERIMQVVNANQTTFEAHTGSIKNEVTISLKEEQENEEQ